MEQEKINAAPTILNTSQLPTRQIKRKTTSQKGASGSIGDIFSQRPQYLSSPFCDIPWSDDTDGSDDYTAEPIDEQEIFGENSLIHPAPHFYISHLSWKPSIVLGDYTG